MRVVFAGLGLWLATAPVHAQDFATPHAWHGAAAMLESGRPPGSGSASVELSSTRWWGLPDLDTHAIAVASGVRSLRWAAGVSRTGAGDLGWRAAALALGAASDRDAIGLRALVRRAAVPGSGEPAGVEVGGAARTALGEAIELCVSAPQLWTHGASPPLRRPLVATLRGDSESAAAWLALEAPRPGAAGERSVGAAVRGAGATAWAEARGAPWRGAFGVELAASRMTLGTRVEWHSELGEIVQLVVAFGRDRGRP